MEDRRRHLAVEVPSGWQVSEGVRLLSPDGVVVTVSLGRRPAGADPEQLVSGWLEVAQAGPASGGGSNAHVAGLDAAWTEVVGDTGGTRYVAAVDGELALTVATSWRSPADGPAAAEAVAAALRVVAPAPLVLTPDELQVLALLHGVDGAPTVAADWWGDADEGRRDVVIDVATRSLLARGVLRDEGGTASIATEVAAVLRSALRPEWTLAIEHLAPDGALTVCWYGGDGLGNAARIAVAGVGARHLTPVEVADVTAAVAGLARPGTAGRSVLRTAWRGDTGALVGAEVCWERAPDGSVGVVDDPRAAPGRPEPCTDEDLARVVERSLPPALQPS